MSHTSPLARTQNTILSASPRFCISFCSLHDVAHVIYVVSSGELASKTRSRPSTALTRTTLGLLSLDQVKRCSRRSGKGGEIVGLN